MKIAFDRQHPANRNIIPWNPSKSVRIGNSLTIKKARLQIRATQNERPNSLIFSGMISDMTKNVKVRIAHDAIKMTHEKLTIGIQLKGSTLNPRNLSMEYIPIVINPSAVPIDDVVNKN